MERAQRSPELQGAPWPLLSLLWPTSFGSAAPSLDAARCAQLASCVHGGICVEHFVASRMSPLAPPSINVVLGREFLALKKRGAGGLFAFYLAMLDMWRKVSGMRVKNMELLTLSFELFC